MRRAPVRRVGGRGSGPRAPEGARHPAPSPRPPAQGGGSHLGRRLAQLRAQGRVLERLAGLVLAQAEAGEERNGVRGGHGRNPEAERKRRRSSCMLTLAHWPIGERSRRGQPMTSFLGERGRGYPRLPAPFKGPGAPQAALPGAASRQALRFLGRVQRRRGHPVHRLSPSALETQSGLRRPCEPLSRVLNSALGLPGSH